MLTAPLSHLKPPCQASRRRQHGMSLIESLVAILVLALGISGLALVQARLLVDGRAASSRAVALALVDDLSNRMMFNKEAALADDYSLSWGEIPMARNCHTTSCSGGELALADLNSWRLAVKHSLPAGNATVFRSSSDSRQFGVAISWALNESKSVDGDSSNYRRPFAVTVAAHGVACPANSLCHVAYVQP